MRTALIPILLALAGASACSTTKHDTQTTPAQQEKPRPAELAALDAFAGKWTGTATVTEATGTVAQMLPPVTDASMKSSPTGMTTAWALDGAFLKSEGWHEEGPGNVVHTTEFMTWDPKQKKYRVWYFSETGESGQGWMTQNGQTWETTSESIKADGTKSTGKGTATMTGTDTMSWTWTENMGSGTLKVIGTNKRK